MFLSMYEMFSGISCERVATPAISRHFGSRGAKARPSDQDCILFYFFSLVCEGMQRAIMQSIVLLIFYSVCRSSLADLTRRPVQLAFKMAMSGLSGDISSYSTRKSAVHTSRTLRTYK